MEIIIIPNYNVLIKNEYKMVNDNESIIDSNNNLEYDIYLFLEEIKNKIDNVSNIDINSILYDKLKSEIKQLRHNIF
jgi:hypothetical protein